jgi:hypothetical protein
LATGRRGTIDLPLAASGVGPATPLSLTLGKAEGTTGASQHGAPAQNSAESDFELNSRFDVPAFLRRQEN